MPRRHSSSAYKKLKAVAEKLGVWRAQRSRALSRVTELIAREATTTARWKTQPSAPDHSLRVEIALWEEDFDTAWAAAHIGICDRHLLIALARTLENSRSGDAVDLYRRVVPAIVAKTDNAAYAEAIKLIRKVGQLMKAQDQSRSFSDYLAELHLQFKSKRNFIKLLAGLAPVNPASHPTAE